VDSSIYLRLSRLLCLISFPVILVLSIGSVTLPAQQKPSGTTAVVSELRQGNNQRALSLANRLLAANPRDCGLLSLKAVALTGLNQPKLALQSFRKALASCPSYLPALEGASQIEYAEHSPETAALLNRILTLQPDNVTAHAMLASVYRSQDKCTEAIDHYEASKALFPSRPELRQEYGSCFAQGGDLKAALVQFQELLASDPNDNTRYNVALLQWKTHADEEALATLAPMLAEGHNEHALALGSKIFEERGETPRAVELLRTAILMATDDVDNYLEFATIAFNHKSFQVGIDMLNAGLTRLPDSAPLYLARGVLEAQLTKNDSAVADFEKAHRLDAKLSFAIDAMGIMQSQQHQDAQSLALFESQAKLHPEDPLLQYLLAEQLSQSAADAGSQNLTAAIEAAKRATALDPKYEPAHDLLAVLYIRAKQPELAIKQAELALALDPNDQVALYQEIMARRRSGDRSQIEALTTRLNEIRKEKGRKQQIGDRYRLQD
jgi:tetratricopeptide (TPR) repeat protein